MKTGKKFAENFMFLWMRSEDKSQLSSLSISQKQSIQTNHNFEIDV